MEENYFQIEKLKDIERFFTYLLFFSKKKKKNIRKKNEKLINDNEELKN